MQYPNIGNPSPQEIYDSYSQIPNTPQGKQQLSQLIQAFKNSGDMRGSIATSILNSYNSQQPPAPPAPQGDIADRVVAQAAPAPQMQGIAAPGLEAMGAPGMAGGGLVAFAEGGPVDGYAQGLQVGKPAEYVGAGRSVPTPENWDEPSWNLEDLASRAWEWGTTPIEGIPSLKDYVSARETPEDYYATTEAPPSRRRAAHAKQAEEISGSSVISPDMLQSLYKDKLGHTPGAGLEMPDEYAVRAQSPMGAPISRPEEEEEEEEVTPTTLRKTGAGESKKASFEERLNAVMRNYDLPPDFAAELISKHEHNQAKQQKFNTFENIAAGLAGYLGAYGTGAHRVGTGIMSMLSTMGRHDKDAREEEATLDALRMKSAMQPYEFRKSITDMLMKSDIDRAKQEEEFRQQIALQGMRGTSAANVARIKAGAVGQGKGQITPALKAQLQTKALEAAQRDTDWTSLREPQRKDRVRNYYNQYLQEENMGGAAQPQALPRFKYTPPPG